MLITAIIILVVSNCDSFRVLLDKIASVYFIRKKYINILALEMASPWEPALYELYQHTFVPCRPHLCDAA